MDDLKLYSRNEKRLDSLVQTKRILSEDTWMEFGTEKCAMLVIEKRKIVESVGIVLRDGRVIKSLQESESYKYLGILQADKSVGEEMKLKVSKEYFRRLRKVLKSKLNGGNLVQGVNTWAVSWASVLKKAKKEKRLHIGRRKLYMASIWDKLKK